MPGLIDVAPIGVIGSPDAPLIAIVVIRLISAALAVPAFFLDVPARVMIVEGFVIAAAVNALVLLRQHSRRPG